MKKILLFLIFTCSSLPISAVAGTHCPGGGRGGIGIIVTFEDGYPVVSKIFSGSPVAVDGKIKIGDRIVAIADETGLTSSTKGMVPEDFACIATGKPATKVTFLVQHKESTGNINPSKVELVRTLNSQTMR